MTEAERLAAALDAIVASGLGDFELTEAAALLRSQAAELAAREGWRWVPVEATQAMRDAGYEPITAYGSTAYVSAAAVWRSMIAACPTPDEQRAQAAQEGGCVEYCKAWPGCTCERSAAPLLGRWHHGAGNLCCGSIRIAHADFDTNPPDKFRDEVFDWVCNTLNAALAGRQQL